MGYLLELFKRSTSEMVARTLPTNCQLNPLFLGVTRMPGAVNRFSLGSRTKRSTPVFVHRPTLREAALRLFSPIIASVPFRSDP